MVVDRVDFVEKKKVVQTWELIMQKGVQQGIVNGLVNFLVRMAHTTLLSLQP